MESEPTNREILEAIYSFAGDIDRRFDGVDKRFASIDQRFDGIEKRFDGIEKRFDGVEKRLNRIEAAMVTKEFLEERLADFKAGLQYSATKVSRQVLKMVNILYKGGVLTAEQVLEIRAD
jgi:archaellum component FlaC